ncbi:MAG: CvpA family protein [Clostridia bacterium]|nr:CvpA family protein [Clostridia bacterium]
MIIDIILIALIALGIFFGYKKGMVGILIGVAALILSLVLAFMLQGPVANYLYTTPIGSGIESNVSKLVNDTVHADENNSQGTTTKEDNNFFNKVIQEASKTDDVVKEASKNFTLFILKGITFVGIFILVRIICYILQMILNVVFDLPILHSVNKLGGVVLSVITTLIKLWIVLAIIQLLSSVVAMDSVTNIINQSYVTKILYENNILINMLQSGIKL